MPAADARRLVSIFLDALTAAHPDTTMPVRIGWDGRQLNILGTSYTIEKPFKVIGFGKASWPMYANLARITGDEWIDEALVVSHLKPGEYEIPHKPGLRVIPGSHPVADRHSIDAGREVHEFASRCQPDDTVIALISGGGSAMMVHALDHIGSKLKLELVTRLLTSGIPEREVNVIRKELSRIKGGKLAQTMAPARVINLILSDERTHLTTAIASGPTVPVDGETAWEIAHRFGITGWFPPALQQELAAGTHRGPQTLPNVAGTHIMGTRDDLLQELRRIALSQGFSEFLQIPNIHGIGPRQARDLFLDAAQKACRFSPETEILIAASGEIPVKAAPGSLGGRNQHVACEMIPFIGKSGIKAFAALATDGRDFLPGIYGASVDGADLQQVSQQKLDVAEAIASTNSHLLHQKLGTLVTGKPTGTNVSDIFLLHVGAK